MVPLSMYQGARVALQKEDRMLTALQSTLQPNIIAILFKAVGKH